MIISLHYATYPSLRDKLAIITGGATGIGESIVRAFSAQGTRVAFLDLAAEPAEALIQSLPENPPIFHPCNLTDLAQLNQAFQAILAAQGPADILINNAANDTRHTIEEVTPAFWDQSIAVNLRHQFFATQAVLPGMKQANRGSIINMSSISWMIPSTGLPLYATAKAAIVGLTRTLAHELGPWNIRVNAVLPGAIQTERQKRLWLTEEYKAEVLSRQALQRLIDPEEVARLILFLAADDSSAITNQSYVIDGGWV
jgi:NAD(P)-dependent dehydrogenase (short-subunit alcohol dehydrogenase family)